MCTELREAARPRNAPGSLPLPTCAWRTRARVFALALAGYRGGAACTNARTQLHTAYTLRAHCVQASCYWGSAACCCVGGGADGGVATPTRTTRTRTRTRTTSSKGRTVTMVTTGGVLRSTLAAAVRPRQRRPSPAPPNTTTTRWALAPTLTPPAPHPRDAAHPGRSCGRGLQPARAHGRLRQRSRVARGETGPKSVDAISFCPAMNLGRYFCSRAQPSPSPGLVSRPRLHLHVYSPAPSISSPPPLSPSPQL